MKPTRAEPLDRREFLKCLALTGAGAVAMTLPFSACVTPKLQRRPNVLFIAIDDLNDWTGCLGGHPDARTPNLDALAKRGMLFTNAHCSGPACCPSRTSLLTGVRPSRSGVYENGQRWPADRPLPMTLTRNFIESGYDVEGCGKIQHGTPSHAQWHLWRGYREFPWENARIPRPGWGVPLKGGDELTGEYKMVEWAKERLDVPRDKPLCLGVGFVRPHLPWNAPKKYFDMFPPDEVTLPEVKESDLDDVPPIGREMAKGGVEKFEHATVLRDKLWRNNVAAYLASVTYADAQLGRLIEAWDRSPLSENGIVVLWSDHGWHLGEKLHWRKFSLWEEATRNVLLFVGPEYGIERGRCDRSVGLQDIYPTLMEICRLQQRNDLDGHSLVPLLDDPTRSWKWPACTTHKYGNHSIRTERWRYTRYRDGGEELYDHDADPMEWTNLADDPKMAEIKQELARWLPAHDAPEVPFNRRK